MMVYLNNFLNNSTKLDFYIFLITSDTYHLSCMFPFLGKKHQKKFLSLMTERARESFLKNKNEDIKESMAYLIDFIKNDFKLKKEKEILLIKDRYLKNIKQLDSDEDIFILNKMFFDDFGENFLEEIGL